jgi:hypothetical protein
MAFAYSPKIVTDGLVFAVDAANKKSYPGSGTTWKDLSGNGNDGTLINGPTFDSGNGGSIVFDGTNDYAQANNLGSILNNFTLTLWYKKSTPSDSTQLIYSRVTGGGFMLGNNDSESRWKLTKYGIVDIYSPLNTVPQDTNWHSVTLRYTNIFGEAVKLYIDNQLVYTDSNNTQNLGTSNIFYIGRAQYGYFDGGISYCTFYNRPLSEQEITQNYNALKSRFGL